MLKINVFTSIVVLSATVCSGVFAAPSVRQLGVNKSSAATTTKKAETPKAARVATPTVKKADTSLPRTTSSVKTSAATTALPDSSNRLVGLPVSSGVNGKTSGVNTSGISTLAYNLSQRVQQLESGLGSAATQNDLAELRQDAANAIKNATGNKATTEYVNDAINDALSDIDIGMDAGQVGAAIDQKIADYNNYTVTNRINQATYGMITDTNLENALYNSNKIASIENSISAKPTTGEMNLAIQNATSDVVRSGNFDTYLNNSSKFNNYYTKEESYNKNEANNTFVKDGDLTGKITTYVTDNNIATLNDVSSGVQEGVSNLEFRVSGDKVQSSTNGYLWRDVANVSDFAGASDGTCANGDVVGIDINSNNQLVLTKCGGGTEEKNLPSGEGADGTCEPDDIIGIAKSSDGKKLNLTKCGGGSGGSIDICETINYIAYDDSTGYECNRKATKDCNGNVTFTGDCLSSGETCAADDIIGIAKSSDGKKLNLTKCGGGSGGSIDICETINYIAYDDSTGYECNRKATKDCNGNVTFTGDCLSSGETCAADDIIGIAKSSDGKKLNLTKCGGGSGGSIDICETINYIAYDDSTGYECNRKATKDCNGNVTFIGDCITVGSCDSENPAIVSIERGTGDNAGKYVATRCDNSTDVFDEPDPSDSCGGSTDSTKVKQMKVNRNTQNQITSIKATYCDNTEETLCTPVEGKYWNATANNGSGCWMMGTLECDSTYTFPSDGQCIETPACDLGSPAIVSIERGTGDNAGKYVATRCDNSTETFDEPESGCELAVAQTERTNASGEKIGTKLTFTKSCDSSYHEEVDIDDGTSATPCELAVAQTERTNASGEKIGTKLTFTKSCDSSYHEEVDIDDGTSGCELAVAKTNRTNDSGDIIGAKLTFTKSCDSSYQEEVNIDDVDSKITTAINDLDLANTYQSKISAENPISISDVSNLQSALDAKQATISTTNPLGSDKIQFTTQQSNVLSSGITETLVGKISTNESAIAGKQDTITTDKPLAQNLVSGLETSLNSKQDTITASNQLSYTLVSGLGGLATKSASEVDLSDFTNSAGFVKGSELPSDLSTKLSQLTDLIDALVQGDYIERTSDGGIDLKNGFVNKQN